MNPPPIHTDTDHAATLARIDALWGAAPGTPAADELDALVTAVAAYEERWHAILPPDPA